MALRFLHVPNSHPNPKYNDENLCRVSLAAVSVFRVLGFRVCLVTGAGQRDFISRSTMGIIVAFMWQAGARNILTQVP